MRRRLPALALAIGAVALASCSDTDDDAAVSTLERPTTAPADTEPVATEPVDSAPADAALSSIATPTTPFASTTTSSESTTTTVAPEAQALELCSYDTTFMLGQVQSPALDEASGLVASRRHGGVIWAHNDGGENPGLFAIARDGTDLGFHPLAIDGVDDVEDVATFSGSSGDDILLADIGDNVARRASIRIYRFAEPDPAVIAPITDVEVIDYVYPDRPHNAEVLLVDEANRQIVIVTKEQGVVDGLSAEFGPTAPSFVFAAPLDARGDQPLDARGGSTIELVLVGMLDTPLLETRTTAVTSNPISLLGFGGVPTGGDVSPDGALIVLRTYETIWLWPRLAERSVADALASDPCQVRVAPEGQGEAVAFFENSLITLSEGSNQPLFELRP